MKFTVKGAFTAVTLTLGFITIYLVLSKPQPIAEAQSPEVAKANTESFDQKLAQLQALRTDSTPAEVHFTSDEVGAEMAQAINGDPAPAVKPDSSAHASPDPTVAPGQVQLKACEMKLDGDIVRGQFVADVAGKSVYITLAGHLGSQDGYATFDPTEFKVGDMSFPISLVNSALQKKLAEQREQLKLPDGIAGLRVENGELVITQK